MTDESKNPDKELDEFLQGNSEFASMYEQASTEEVPARLDSAVLRMARESQHRPVIKSVSPFSNNWKVPLSLAAVLVLSVTVILKMENTAFEGGRVEADRSNLHDSPATARSTDKFEREHTVATGTEKGFNSLISEPENDEQGLPAAMPAGEVEIYYEEERSLDEVEKKQTRPVPSPVPKTYTAGPRLEQLDSSEPITLDSAPADILSQNAQASSKARVFVRKKETVSHDMVRQEQTESTLDNASQASKKTSSATSKDGVDRWLNKIKTLWEKGHKDEAREAFNMFRKHYPGVSEQTLLDVLGADAVRGIQNNP